MCPLSTNTHKFSSHSWHVPWALALPNTQRFGLSRTARSSHMGTQKSFNHELKSEATDIKQDYITCSVKLEVPHKLVLKGN